MRRLKRGAVTYKLAAFLILSEEPLQVSGALRGIVAEGLPHRDASDRRHREDDAVWTRQKGRA